MKIELHEISIADIVNGYKDDNEGGKTEKANCQMLCRECNRRKSNK